MSELRILPQVAQDIASAARWYDQNAYDGLGDRFTETFYACLPDLCERGRIYRTVHSDFRRILLPRFPYAVFFRYYSELLIVTLVIHAARDPALIQSLLKTRR